MKTKKILAIALIIISILIGISYSVFGGNDNRTKLEIGKDQTTQDLGYRDMASKYNNIYCIEHGQSMNRSRRYTIKTKVVIKGNIAEIYTKTNGEYTLDKTVNNEANNVMAAILTDGLIDGKEAQTSNSQYTCGYKVNGSYTDAQLGLYQYLDTWVDAIGGSEYGFDGKNRAITGNQAKIASAVIAQAEAKAEEYLYNLTLYLLYRPVNYYQSLIVTDPEEPTPIEVNVPVTKVWLDGENTHNTRPSDITVKLLANGVEVKTEKLNQENGWAYIFEGLDVFDDNNQKIQYSVEEVNVPEKYSSSISGDMNVGYTITNRLKTDVKVVKSWMDEDNLDELRPAEIQVILLVDGLPYKNEDGTDKTVTLNEAQGWNATFTDLYQYDLNGNEMQYTVQENVVAEYEEPQYGKTTTGDGTIVYTITNTHKPDYAGYIEITGKVWLDKLDLKSNIRNGLCDDDESGLSGIKVTLKDATGNQFDETSTVVTDSDGKYTIKVNYDNRENVYKLHDDIENVISKLSTAYVEFEYNAMKYTTVATAPTGDNTSKAIENETIRNNFDNTYSKVTSSTAHPDEWIDNKIVAITKDVISFGTYTDKETTKRDEIIKFCNGDGTYEHTNPNGAWNDPIKGTHTCEECQGTGHSARKYKVGVETIKNVNLGLFEIDQPNVALISDLTKVEVTMNGQKYTYKYGVKSDETEDVGLKAQFETKYTYEYKRPVNPSDISYIQEEANKDAMSVFVTYEVKFANLSNEVDTTLHNITNYFDKRYTLITEGWTTTVGTDFNKSTYNGDLNITLEPLTRSEGIELTYSVSVDAIRELLSKDATLNHASEIEAYSTKYGNTTIYAEQRSGGRTGNAYAGYDYGSHPGNAGMFINADGRLEAAKFEDDTDIAPSFVLCKDESKTLSGTVYEDTNIKTNGERVGDGKFDNSSEKGIRNVKVELYNIDGTLAKLYPDKNSTQTIDAVTYTESNGDYSFKGVATGEYFIKFTYGNDTTELTKGATTIDGTTTINARNYKSTIITNSIIKGLFDKSYSNFSEDDKKWHINIEDGSSVAVDNMLERVAIEDLQYNNFDKPLNMTAYTKPFKTQVEFDADGEGNADNNGEIGISNDLTKLDFGIIERPREDLFVEKTITNIKLILANGQTLIEGDPRTQTLNYAKTMGFKQSITNGLEARNALPKRLLVEMDVELIQGSELELQYEIKVTNNNELDYDYGSASDYSDIVNGEYITKNDLANYYYFGESAGLNPLQSKIEFVDYLSGDIIYKVEEDKWTAVDVNTLFEENNKLISDETYKAIKDSQYKIFKNKESSSITLARGASWTQNMTVSKSLSNDDENVYDNSLEIIKIDGKTARTIQESDGGKQVRKSYTPGNYIPASSNGEQDDDVVEVILTPPTGIAKYVITYLVAGLAGLIVIAIVVIFIKKKVLTK